MTSREQANHEMTVNDLLLAIAQTYEWGKSARLSADEKQIVGCQFGFVSFNIPTTYDAICKVEATFNMTLADALRANK